MKQIIATVIAVAVPAMAATADETAPADVVNADGIVEQSLTGVPGDPENGAVIMKTKSAGNCISCHEVTALKDAQWHGNIGPVLDGAGDRWEEAQLRAILTDAKSVFPDSMMPSYYKVDGFTRPGDAFTGKAPSGPLEPLLNAQQIEDVIAFLLTQKES
ncbi:sulfur oxidation c-type cytochrome SoxX [Pukyongiella litopenaei]|uniref:Sulfur oxidation c-type cytochrome SoxX n=1 Tax=Pukyongiella litopenaei TaxID=2605946 RepID=A0A2S0MUX7_9RHOB|nr:sulfur oxidation c-type cytochrome SoxX [Pukyongiella litopenaei]AVO39662.1 sulfur oxidation c-type cytochrome SoxX [Pukyongiella litopenaei]